MSSYPGGDPADGITFMGTTDRGPNQGCKDIKDGAAAVSGGSCTAADPSDCNGYGRAYYGVDTYRNQTMAQASAGNLGQGFAVPR